MLEEYFKFNDSTTNAALAAILHLSFKLFWIGREESAVVKKLKNWFLNALQEYCSAQQHFGSVHGAQVENDGDLNSRTLDFFTFMDAIDP